MAYDIIGDIHGQAEKLKALLKKLGYRVRNGAYRHPEGRTAAILGDLIDRGPAQIEVINIVRNMIEAGSGLTIMGNHEWNAIGFGTLNPDGSDYLRTRTDNKRREHKEFLKQIGEDSDLHKELVEWFKTLPPLLDFGSIRLCHAWWEPGSIDLIKAAMDRNGRLDDAFLMDSYCKHSIPWKAIECVTKGCEVCLPDGNSFRDHNDVPRKEIRIRWWDESATSYRRAALVPENEQSRIPEVPLPDDVKLGATSAVPTFVGHYWLTGTPGVQNPTTAVLDYGAALNGPLVGYRWDGEVVLSNDKLVWV